MRGLRGLLASVLLASAFSLLAGCAELPVGVSRPESRALPLSGSTPLGALAAGLHGPAGASGFRLLASPDFAFDARSQLIARAAQSLDLQYYLVHDDESGRQILRLLRDAARRGVRVRLLVDDLYTSGQDDLLLGLAAFENVEVRLFNPFPAGREHLGSKFLASLFNLDRMQRRMHNKMLIADGAFAVIGGRNIADDYFQRSDVTRFLDLDALTVGALVPRLSEIFDDYWNSAAVYPIQAVASNGQPADKRRKDFDEHVGSGETLVPEGIDNYGLASIGAELQHGRLTFVWARADAFADSPEKVFSRQRDSVRLRLRERIRTATKEVKGTTPYFVPGPLGMQTIRQMRERGVQLSVTTNSLASTDVPLAHAGYMRYRADMLRLGVQINEVIPSRVARSHRFVLPGHSRGRLHAKVMVIDGKEVFLGSMNLDPRSDSQNTELGVFIDSPELAQQILAIGEMVRRDATYQLRLAQDGTIEWVDLDADGNASTVYSQEPDTSPATRLWYRLLGAFVPESWL